MCPIVVSLKSVRFVMFAALLAAGLMTFAPAAAVAQTRFFAVGDLPGGPFSSAVRDATKAGGVIYAVGGSAARPQTCPDPCQNTDTAILWRWDGSSASLTPLPDLVAINVANTSTPLITASAITPSGAFIASRARSNPSNGQRQAVRVEVSGLINTNLNAAPFPVYNLPDGSPGLSAAVAISYGGSVVYGLVKNLTRAARVDVDGPRAD